MRTNLPIISECLKEIDIENDILVHDRDTDGIFTIYTYKIIANIDFKDDLSPIDTSQVFNGINYARMLNGMAKWLDIDGRVDVMSLREEASRDVSDVSDIVLLNIRRTFQDLPRVPRIPNKPITNQDVELRGDLPDTQVISTRAV